MGIKTASGDNHLPACVYCSQRLAVLTSDHIPPKCLFAKPRPSSLITVPACAYCNSSFKLDDEYFRLMVCGRAAYYDREATRLWKDRVIPHTGVGLRKSLLQGIKKLPFYSEAGIYLGTKSAFGFDCNRIQNVLRRIAAGLLWHHYGLRVRPKANILVEYEPDIEVVKDLLLVTSLAEIGGSVFRYRYGLAEDSPDVSFWGMQFYERAHFVVIIDGTSLHEISS
jgi:hypothetical protein